MNVNNSIGIGAYTSQVTTNKTDSKKTSSYGNTIGDVKLSDSAAKYYEELKSKYKDMDFVLVSDDETDNVEDKAQKYASDDKTLVIIDAATVEKMASDESYRTQYEGIIDNAKTDLAEMKDKLESSGAEVKSYGIRVNSDGTVSFFAELKKSSAYQKERIEKRAEEKKAEKKAAEKKAEKEKSAERLNKKEDTETVTASSVEELLTKVSDFAMAQRSDNIQTEAELQVGQHIDFRG